MKIVTDQPDLQLNIDWH